MKNTNSILSQKLAYEQFSREMVHSDYLTGLTKNNKASRHVLRFLSQLLLFSVWLISAKVLFALSPFLMVVVYPAYLYFQGLLIAGSMIHSHELSHNHIQRRWLNDLIGILSGLISYINFYSFQNAHRIHHKNIGNLDTPEVGAPISLTGQTKIPRGDKLNKIMVGIFARSKVVGFISSWPLFIFYGDYNSWLLPFRRADKIDRKSLVVFTLFLTINLTLLTLFPLHYILLYLFPMLVGGNRILIITSMHHAHEDTVFFNEKNHNFFNTIMSTTDRDFGRIVNFFMMNNGYHIPHHLNPRIAYYDLKKASAYLRDKIPGNLNYNYYPDSRFYRDFANSFYEQRLDQDHEVYQLKFLTREQIDERARRFRMG